MKAEPKEQLVLTIVEPNYEQHCLNLIEFPVRTFEQALAQRDLKSKSLGKVQYS